MGEVPLFVISSVISFLMGEVPLLLSLFLWARYPCLLSEGDPGEKGEKGAPRECWSTLILVIYMWDYKPLYQDSVSQPRDTYEWLKVTTQRPNRKSILV